MREHALHGPRARPRDGGEVLLHGERAEDVALLRHPADAGVRAPLGALARDVAAVERGCVPAVCVRDADDGVDQRGLADAVAAEQRQRLAVGQREADVGQHDGLAVAGGEALDLQQVSHAPASPR